MKTNPPGAQFKISVDGKPRSYRDTKSIAIEAAEFLKSRQPDCEVAVKDLQSGETTGIAFNPSIPLYQPYSYVAMQKRISGYRYWFHRQMDYRTLVKA